jgi:uncharacterized protein (DUF1778 family)
MNTDQATENPEPEDGLYLDPQAWKELLARLIEPPSEALRKFMATPSIIENGKLEQMLRARYLDPGPK